MPRYAVMADEDGFAFIEVIVSAVLFLVLATATLAVVDRSGNVANANRSRSIATAIAQADQDSMRQSPPALLTNLHATTSKTVSGITYTIKSDAEWFRDATGVVSCNNSGARAEYVQITSQVTWPTMGTIKPVTMESYVTPGLTSLTRGALTVNLSRSDASGTAGIVVTATPAGGGPVTGITDANGCVVLGNLAPGSAGTTWSTTGYVNKDGSTTVPGTANIATGVTSNVSDSYDQSGKALIQFQDDSTPAKAAAAGWPSVTALQTGMTNGMRVFRDTANPQVRTPNPTFDGLFPFTSSYSFYAGDCAGADPSKYQKSYVYAGGIVPRAGTIGPLTATLPTQTFDIANTTKTSAVYMQVKPPGGVAAMSACSKVRFPLLQAENIPSTSKWTVPLPYGQWQVCFDNGTKSRTVGSINNTGPGGTTLVTGAPAPTTGTTAVADLNAAGSTAGPCT
jgi:Tfp pilus assembly protein PilV